MTEVDGEYGDAGVDVDAFAVRIDETVHREHMSEVMQTRDRAAWSSR